MSGHPLPLGGICALTLCLRPRGSANHFQGGPTVDVFGANGSNPTANWKVTGTVQKVYDKALKSHVFVCDGGPSAKMQLPKDDRRSLGLVQPYLALQINVPDSKPFALELSISDTARARRRLLFSTSFREAVCTPLHTRVPLGSLPRGVWVTLVLDMAFLTSSNFGGARFGRLEGIIIGASVRLRKICTLKDTSFIGPGGIGPCFLGPGDCISSDHPAYAATVPKGMELPPEVESYTHMFTQGGGLHRSASSEAIEAEGGTLHAPSQHPSSPTRTMAQTVPRLGLGLGFRYP